jgi:hypothetical protein
LWWLCSVRSTGTGGEPPDKRGAPGGPIQITARRDISRRFFRFACDKRRTSASLATPGRTARQPPRHMIRKKSCCTCTTESRQAGWDGVCRPEYLGELRNLTHRGSTMAETEGCTRHAAACLAPLGRLRWRRNQGRAVRVPQGPGRLPWSLFRRYDPPAIDLGTLVGWHEHGHSRAAHCPRCDPWRGPPFAIRFRIGHPEPDGQGHVAMDPDSC